MKKLKKSAAALAVSFAMLPVIPSAIAGAADIPSGTLLYKDTLATQSVGEVPSDWFCVDSQMKKSTTALTASDVVIAADPMLPTGKYINIGTGTFSNNLFADMDTSVTTLNATGPSWDRQTLYAISWNQFIAEGQQEHTSWTQNRTSVLRFIGKDSEGKYDDTWSKALGTAHFGGSKLNIIDGSTKKAESTTALTRGKWYTFKAYIHANQNGTYDDVNLIAYEYGTNESDAISASLSASSNGSFPVNADAFKIYNYDVDAGNKKAISDIKIRAYTDTADASSFKTVNEAAKSVDIESITSKASITEADELNITIPEGCSYAWSSNNNDVISVGADGTTLSVTRPAEDTKLCLTLTLMNNSASTELYVPVTVKAAEPTVTDVEFEAAGTTEPAADGKINKAFKADGVDMAKYNSIKFTYTENEQSMASIFSISELYGNTPVVSGEGKVNLAVQVNGISDAVAASFKAALTSVTIE